MPKKRAPRRPNGTPRAVNPVAEAARRTLDTLALAEQQRLAPVEPRPAGPSRLPWPTSAELPPVSLEEAAQLAALRLLTQHVREQARAALDAGLVTLAKTGSQTEVTQGRLDCLARYHAVSAEWDQKITEALAREHELERTIHEARVARWRFPNPDMRAVYREVFGEDPPPPAPVRPPDPPPAPPVTAAPVARRVEDVPADQLLAAILARPQ